MSTGASPDSLAGLLQAALGRHSHPLLVDATGREHTGPGLLEGAERWAHWLRAAGIGAGTRVALTLPNGAPFVQLLLACQRVGATFCPLPTSLVPTDAAARLEALDAGLHVRAGEAPPGGGWEVTLGARAETPPLHVPTLRAALRPPSPELAAILWSSGTSGLPRAVGLSGGNLHAQVTSHLPLLGLSSGSRVLSYLSWAHCFGLAVELLPSLVSGASLWVDGAAGRDVGALAALARQVRPTHLFTVPRLAEALLATPASAEGLSSLEGGVVGAACLTPSLAERLTRARWPLRQGYGQTECSPGVTLGTAGDFRPGNLGRPVGCEVRSSAAGELLVRGPNVLTCCWSGRPPAFEGDWLCTGDLVQPLEDGTWEWLGRRDDCFKLSNGKMVNPHPLEQAWLAANPSVQAVVVVGAGADAVVPLVRWRVGRRLASLRPPEAPGVPMEPAVILDERFWRACETPTGKLVRSRVQAWVVSPPGPVTD